MREMFQNWVRIDSTGKLWVFVTSITVLCLIVVNGMTYFVMDSEYYWKTRVLAVFEVLLLSLPISYVVGKQIQKIVKLKDDLEFALHHDPLTGAGTRTLMDQFLARGSIIPCPVIMTDIDHFKRVNDEFGHLAGDRVLASFVQLLARQASESDLVVRMGGEEFLIILPFTSIEAATEIAERMRGAIAAHKLDIFGQDLTITARFGIGIIWSETLIEDGIHQVDKALYLAKNSGRNQVCLVSDDHKQARLSA